jgi:hypothetical protein
MNEKDVETLLEQINAMVDNVDDPSVENRRACALEIQRLAANLPKLVRQAAAGWESARLAAIFAELPSTEAAADIALASLRETTT